MAGWQEHFLKSLDEIFEVPSTHRIFNFYADSEPRIDLAGAPGIRRENLKRYILSLHEPRVVIIGEAPGPRGARFSGVPFTSEAQLAAGMGSYSGRRSSRREHPFREASATIFQAVLALHQGRYLAWNSFPYLPHRPGEPGRLRAPTPLECAAHVHLIVQLVRDLKPEIVIALGRRAEKTLERAGIPASYVRHPSRGGAPAFRSGISALAEHFK